MPGEAGRSADGVLTDALTTLKRQGSSLLVVGAVTGDASDRACRQMLGHGDSTDRRRLLVFTDADGHRASDRLSGEDGRPATDDVTLIEHSGVSRSVAASGGVGTAGTPESPSAPSVSDTLVGVEPDYEVDVTNLAELGETVTDAVEAIEADAGGLAPAELRLCLDSLLPLLETNGDEAVFRFLHVLTSHVRQNCGMAHVHLPVEPSSTEANLFAPLFDAVVELRSQNGRTQQRWHVPDADVSTDWLAV